jgi:RNA polymerase sigma factor (TIGR02999 family)
MGGQTGSKKFAISEKRWLGLQLTGPCGKAIVVGNPGDRVEQVPPQSLHKLLADWQAGDQKALHALVPLVYAEVHGLAHHYLRGERPGHTLQTTALINEAYLRLTEQGPFQTQNRGQFVALAAHLMRQILVDYARSHRSAKRGNDCKVAPHSEPRIVINESMDLVALDDALQLLAQRDLQQSQIVELRFFAGLTVEETAATLGISPATVKRDWSMARAWLSRKMNRGEGGHKAAVGKD